MGKNTHVEKWHREKETARHIVELHKHNPRAAKAAYDVFKEELRREAIYRSAPPERVSKPVDDHGFLDLR